MTGESPPTSRGGALIGQGLSLGPVRLRCSARASYARALPLDVVLREAAEDLEREVRAPLEWDIVPGRRAQRVAAFSAGHLFDGTSEDVENMTEWAVTTMDRLVQSLQPRLQTA